MLSADTTSGKYWRKCGEDALKNKVKGIIIIGAHWECLGDQIEVATNPTPDKTPCPFSDQADWINWKPNPDVEGANRCIKMLDAAGYRVSGNSTTPWHHDVFMVLIRMFPEASTCPPTVILSSNARYDPHYHMKMGATLRKLRHEGYLLIGTGGAVHNLYRNIWSDMLLYRESLGQQKPPEEWALEFRQATEDAITKNSGPELRAALVRLMKHPAYREAHATDEHFIPALFCAGAAGDWEDVGSKNILGAESWELTNMCNSQYTLGEYGYTGSQARTPIAVTA